MAAVGTKMLEDESSDALPPHDHTIEPGEINRRGCRRCQIESEAELGGTVRDPTLRPGVLRCGFCQRPWETCEADCCSERRAVLLYAKLIGCDLSPGEEVEISRLRTPKQMAWIRGRFPLSVLRRLARSTPDYYEHKGYYLPDVAALAHAEWERAETLREERVSIERDAAKLILISIRRGDEFWQEQLQHAFDLTIAEAEKLATPSESALTIYACSDCGWKGDEPREIEHPRNEFPIATLCPVCLEPVNPEAQASEAG